MNKYRTNLYNKIRRDVIELVKQTDYITIAERTFNDYEATRYTVVENMVKAGLLRDTGSESPYQTSYETTNKFWEVYGVA